MKTIFQKFLTENSLLSNDEIEEIVNCFYEKLYLKNDFWIRQNEKTSDIAFVCKGILRVFNSIDGEEITLQFIFPNSFASSFVSSKNNKPSPWSFQALTDCILLLLNIEEHHKLMFKYENAFRIYENQLLKTYLDVESRLFSFLHLNAEQRFNKLFSENPEIFNIIPLKQIASSLGITPETLSRFRKKHFK